MGMNASTLIDAWWTAIAKTEMQINWPLIASLCVTTSCLGRTISANTVGPFHSEFRIASQSAFTPANLEFIARRYAARAAKKYLLSEVVIVTSEQSISDYLGLILTEVSYEGVMEKRHEMKASPIARIVTAGASMILQVRYPDGRLENRILAGENPLLFETAGKKYEILNFSISRATRSPASGVSLGFRIRAIDSVPSPKEAVVVWQALHNRFNVKSIGIVMRKGYFFATPSFPLTFPFADEPAPTSQQYHAEMETGCFNEAASVDCMSSGENPEAVSVPRLRTHMPLTRFTDGKR